MLCSVSLTRQTESIFALSVVPKLYRVLSATNFLLSGLTTRGTKEAADAHQRHAYTSWGRTRRVHSRLVWHPIDLLTLIRIFLGDAGSSV